MCWQLSARSLCPSGCGMLLKNCSVKTSWNHFCTPPTALFLNETSDFPFRSVDLSLWLKEVPHWLVRCTHTHAYTCIRFIFFYIWAIKHGCFKKVCLLTWVFMDIRNLCVAALAAVANYLHMSAPSPHHSSTLIKLLITHFRCHSSASNRWCKCKYTHTDDLIEPKFWKLGHSSEMVANVNVRWERHYYKPNLSWASVLLLLMLLNLLPLSKSINDNQVRDSKSYFQVHITRNQQ